MARSHWPDYVLAAAQGARARAVHGQDVEQAHQGEKPVYLAVRAACDRESAVLGPEALVAPDEYMNAGRVHERNLRQIYYDRTRPVLENRPENLPQQRGSRDVDLAGDSDRVGSDIAVDRERTRPERTGRTLHGAGSGVRRKRRT